ncbi:MAG: 4Fe-4S dicluster domain-containing protein [Polyangiaceae bacterium]|nr:4Fe-4S dicluster domain-containing protein [Polyangiaceae bacterium]
MESHAPWQVGSKAILSVTGLGDLLGRLWAGGRQVVGPVVRDGAICLGPVRTIADLPKGLTDEHGPGTYRLKPRGDEALFGFTVGQHAFKRSILLPEVALVQLRRKGRDVEVEPATPKTQPLALLGVRACDAAALGIQDKVLCGGPYADSDYEARRADVLVIAVQCTNAASTCFCASMGTGPHLSNGFDLALTELLSPTHRFLVEVGSPAGATLANQLELTPVSEGDLSDAKTAEQAALTQMGRHLETAGLREKLQQNPDDSHWENVANRCLSCANCTMVCPTCFCTTMEDRTDLTGDIATRIRRYDSCFSEAFAYVHGGSVRPTVRARYRQWLTHKLSTWVDQFGSLGCVGCGRCITFCPVGIDITAEAKAVGAPARTG